MSEELVLPVNKGVACASGIVMSSLSSVKTNLTKDRQFDASYNGNKLRRYKNPDTRDREVEPRDRLENARTATAAPSLTYTKVIKTGNDLPLMKLDPKLGIEHKQNYALMIR
ncbi:hypothetical protein ACJRO7_016162 [Eucalyptus globulus]|uniref:Uncharacterized protein n=1 Tax=Eucalyptus globulus TaxID=34317 RepID=A0ABD3L663_EUCGL